MDTETGQAMVEMAATITILVLVLLFVFDFGRAVVITASMASSAQSAAREGAITTNSGLIQAAATADLVLVSASDVTVTVDQTSTYTEVTLTTTFQPITPMIAVFTGESGITLSQSARMAILGTVITP